MMMLFFFTKKVLCKERTEPAPKASMFLSENPCRCYQRFLSKCLTPFFPELVVMRSMDLVNLGSSKNMRRVSRNKYKCNVSAVVSGHVAKIKLRINRVCEHVPKKNVEKDNVWRPHET
jgi:hypothetical protein